MDAFNYIDILIILALALYILLHIKDGVFLLTTRLIGFVGGAVLAFFVYADISKVLSPHMSLPPGVTEALSFVLAFIIIQWALKFVLRKIFSLIPENLQESKISKYLAVVPAFIDGAILISLLLFLIVVSPFFISAKRPIEQSKLGRVMIGQAGTVENYLDKVFSKATESTLGFLTVEPEEGETVTLPFTATNLSVDEKSEEEMLLLLNKRRMEAGVAPVIMDATLRAVARKHSQDMWERSYFAHENPDGLDPFDRMRAGGAKFRTAGENLALARTAERADDGLYKSPGHKRNMLDPAFTRVGIGVIDGGVYGKMFTEDFSD